METLKKLLVANQILVLLSACSYLYYRVPPVGNALVSVFFAICCVSAMLTWLCAILLFPQEAQYDSPARSMLSNSMLIGAGILACERLAMLSLRTGRDFTAFACFYLPITTAVLLFNLRRILRLKTS